jgi:translation initiation factor IF-1
MSKQDNITIDGTIEEVLPATTFRVLLENGHTIIATLGGRLRQHNIRIALGDRVEVAVSPYDLSRGRITYRR